MRGSLIAAIVVAAATAAASTAAAEAPAEDLYVEGQAAYDRADYSAAIALWQASYDLSRASGLLFNLAQAKRLTGDCAGALSTYRRFVAEAPGAPQRALAEDLATELEARCPAPPAPAEALMAPEPLSPGSHVRDHENPPPSGRLLRGAGIAVGVAGAAGLAAGLVLGHQAGDLERSVTAACRTVCDWTLWRDEDAKGRRRDALGRAFDVAGLLGITGGAVLYYLGARRAAPVVSQASDGRGTFVSWGGAW